MILQNAKYLILILLLTSIQCREEIVDPGNITGGINSPVKYSSYSNYSFIIDAENLNYNINESLILNTLSHTVRYYLYEYEKGAFSFDLINERGNPILSEVLTANVVSERLSIDGTQLSTLSMRFGGFTGKVKIEIFRK